MQEVYEFLKQCGTYYLATVEGDQPRVRPFGTVDLYEGKLYIQTGKKKDVSKQMHENGKVEICAFQNGTWSAWPPPPWRTTGLRPRSICWTPISVSRPCTSPATATPRFSI